MAITPWSWTASNGTASVSQTKAAYTVLVEGGMTYSFSRLVWNDIITKINEVANALGKGWQSEYLSYSNTKMWQLFSPLSAARFNSARYNTNYLTWTWSYDPQTKGYVGRTDFVGVADVGEKDADFVYGSYILELVKRLNTVIDIINGTGQQLSLTETIGCFVETTTELIAVSPQGLEAGDSFSITHSGTMELEKQRSWILHFRISMPTHKATLEIGNFSFAEGSLWTRLAVDDKFRVSPSNPMKVQFYFPQEFKTIHTVLPSEPLRADYIDTAVWDASIIERLPQPLTASFTVTNGSDDCIVLLQPITFSSGGAEQLRHSAVMKTERMGLFAAQTMLNNYYKATAKADHSAPFEKAENINLLIERSMHTGFASQMEKALDCTLDICSEAHVPKGVSAYYLGNCILTVRQDAHIAHSEIASSKHSILLTTAQKLNRYHSTLFSHIQSEAISHYAEMMQQQMGFFFIDHRIGYTVRSRLTTLGAFPLAIDYTDTVKANAEFSPEVMQSMTEHFIQPSVFTARLQSEDLPSMFVDCVNPVSWITDFSFLSPYLFQATGTQRNETAGTAILLPASNAGVMENAVVKTEVFAEAKMFKPIGGSLKERFLTTGNAKVGYVNRLGGEVDSIIRIDISEMSCARGALELGARSDSFSDTAGEMVVSSPMALSVVFENRLVAGANLGFVRYAYLKAECINESVIKADLETNGEWIYPAQTGSDLYVVQVYETDRFDEAAFFDYGKFIAHTQMQSGIPISNIDHQIHSAADCEIVLKIQPSVELNFVDVSAWEYPIQNGSDLTVTQVGFIKQHQYKLEVK